MVGDAFPLHARRGELPPPEERAAAGGAVVDGAAGPAGAAAGAELAGGAAVTAGALEAAGANRRRGCGRSSSALQGAEGAAEADGEGTSGPPVRRGSHRRGYELRKGVGAYEKRGGRDEKASGSHDVAQPGSYPPPCRRPAAGSLRYPMPNRLDKEASPYLPQQHAHNPVDWYPWGPEALERAKREDKPSSSASGYSACHWCHVMERESFENEQIANLMNGWFVNVKVDREERPDLEQVYQLVGQLMGRSGGWPLTVFLTPDQRPFFGGTYFPPVDRYGMPGFPKVLQAIWEAYHSKRDEVVAQSARDHARHRGGERRRASPRGGACRRFRNRPCPPIW